MGAPGFSNAFVLAASIGIAALAPSSAVAATPSNPGNTKNCTDFSNWGEAQVWFETYAAVYGDVAQLDADNDGVPCELLINSPSTTPAAALVGSGYMMLESNGSVFGFGDMRPVRPMVASASVSVAAGPGGGYWLLGRDGTVSARGVSHFGNVADKVSLPADESATTIAGLPDGSGYWVFTNKGRAIAFGSAQSFGDASEIVLNGPVIASAVTPSGKGYWMVGDDGGIFTFGDAKFYGSTGGSELNAPVVGIAPDPDGVGYWLVAADGGIFAFDATFKGSMGGTTLNKPIIGFLAYGDGYLMVASDGGIFASSGPYPFTSKPFLGSLGGTPPANPIVGVAVRPT